MRILIAGASGFIGSHVAAHLAARGHEIVGAARDARWAAGRYHGVRWVEADFRKKNDWAAHLEGVSAVINCVGVLQDGGADSTQAAHVDGARALFDACERVGVRRVIQISAVGADPGAGTAYARSKHKGDADLMARDLDWAVLKPSLVVARNVYGGTALVRGLAGIPFATPVIASPGMFRPIHLRDACSAIERLLSPDAPTRVVIDLAGPVEQTLPEVIAAHRAWLGFGRARIWTVPKPLADLAFALGDLLGVFGVRTSLKSTSRAQMAHDVGGDPNLLTTNLGMNVRGGMEELAAEPAGVQDRWHARLYFVKPAARLLLAAFWMFTGIVCLTTGRDEAMALACEAGLGRFDALAADLGGLFDIAIGAAFLFLAKRRRAILALMALVSIGYLAVLSVTLPWLWADPLGRLMKLLPFFALLAFVAAVEDER
ncbi:MAG: SDR family oxidoreductase [Hyphomonadaceae bacterium]